MTFGFEKDYLQDLEPVLARLRNDGFHDVVRQIADCKAAGSMGGEILSCINPSLRQTLDANPSKELRGLIDSYLRKAPGY